MSQEQYVFAVCLIVLVIFVVVFTALIGSIVMLNLRLIKNGVEDDKIEKEFNRRNTAWYKTLSKISRVFGGVISAAVFVFFLVAFVLAQYSNADASRRADDIPLIKVVMTESMSEKHKLNTYLYDNNLDNQLQPYDLLVIRELPPEEELALYDIVVYEIEGELIIHRIVGIEEPNEEHAERHFLLQGDALSVHDKFPVLYEQMRGIYREEKVSFVGSFFLFMRSPGGYMCLILSIVAFLIMPVVDGLIERAKKKRWYNFYWYCP